MADPVVTTTNLAYPETGQTTQADFAPEITIDYVNRFSEGIRKLTKVLGITSMTRVPQGGVIKSYKYTSDIKDGNVAEGQYIPLSTVKRVADKTIEFEGLNKWRRNTSAEAIQRFGRAQAINNTDSRMVFEVQKLLRNDLITAVTSTEKTAPEGVNLQAALANMWGALTQIFEDYDGFADPDSSAGDGRFVFFVNPLDVAAFLGTATLTTQTAFGMTYLADFLGLGNTFTSAKVPQGTVFGTAVSNLNLYYIPANGGDLATTFGLTSDSTGLIGMTHSVVTTNASVDTLVLGKWLVFPEVEDAVLKGTVTGGGAANAARVDVTKVSK